MNFWKKLFGGSGRGDIKYVLLVASLPEEPLMAHMSSFLFESLPELKQADAKIGFVWKTDPIDSIDMHGLAVNAFGSEVANENRYIYRTIGYKLSSGHAKVLVIYEKR